jgi:hypothetical protein
MLFDESFVSQSFVSVYGRVCVVVVGGGGLLYVYAVAFPPS